jgi:hypothetical protein
MIHPKVEGDRRCESCKAFIEHYIKTAFPNKEWEDKPKEK